MPAEPVERESCFSIADDLVIPASPLRYAASTDLRAPLFTRVLQPRKKRITTPHGGTITTVYGELN